MRGSGEGRVLYVIVCAAGPAGEVGRLIALAQDRGWEVQVIATLSALAFLDVPQLELLTSSPVRSEYRSLGEPKSPRADAIIVAPATFNTINKFAGGTSDTYALGILAEAPGLGIPVVILPFVNAALAERIPFQHSVARLRAEGVVILLGADQYEPHPPGEGGDRIDSFPWEIAIAAVEAQRSPS